MLFEIDVTLCAYKMLFTTVHVCSCYCEMFKVLFYVIIILNYFLLVYNSVYSCEYFLTNIFYVTVGKQNGRKPSLEACRSTLYLM